MKLNQLAWIGLSAFVIATAPATAQPLVRAASLAAIAQSSLSQASLSQAQASLSQAQATTISAGTFAAAEKPTTGTARIIQVGEQRYVELDSAFSTSDQGPDLHVLLDTATQPPASYATAGQTVNLGRLQSYSGTQRYAIPANVDVGQYNSVVIWCQMANATFGYAPLQTATGQTQPDHQAFNINSLGR